jgi:hypothetical protein
LATKLELRFEKRDYALHAVRGGLRHGSLEFLRKFDGLEERLYLALAYPLSRDGLEYLVLGQHTAKAPDGPALR